ncbi:hypothetical protein RUM44_006944 [Polyplax serrata]|uniref:Uncharacterized protein n=1 Tax=Polyplax serrata TaxID=468196 RepID=A0ABR1AZB9_POLSC
MTVEDNPTGFCDRHTGFFDRNTCESSDGELGFHRAFHLFFHSETVGNLRVLSEHLRDENEDRLRREIWENVGKLFGIILSQGDVKPEVLPFDEKAQKVGCGRHERDVSWIWCAVKIKMWSQERETGLAKRGKAIRNCGLRKGSTKPFDQKAQT